MSRLSVSAVAVVFLGAAASAQAPAYRIEATDRQAVAAVITYEVRTAEFAAARWVAFLPEPPELPSQTRVKAASEPAGKVVSEKGSLERKVRMIDVRVKDPKPGAKLTLRLEVEATLRSRRLVPLGPGEKPPEVAPLTAAESKAYLASSEQADYEARAFRDWLDARKLRLGKAEPPVEFAARILAVLRSDFEYRYDPNEDRRASVVCGRKGTDCGGMSYLFVAAMRANGVPARVLVGRAALPRKPGSTPADLEYDRPHARAEFFVAGVGWVPVDPVYAHENKDRPVAAFVGEDPGDLLVLHVGSDLKLPFPDQVRNADLLQLAPVYWATGRGTFDGTLGPSGWELKSTPAPRK